MFTRRYNLPSVKTLRDVFGENAKQARKILEMTRRELEALPAGAARVRECYNPPATSDLRLTCLNELAGTHGVEAFETRHGWCEYLNAGDTYSVTLVRYRGRYRVTTWGDIAERDG
jgi:hypothetical protein